MKMVLIAADDDGAHPFTTVGGCEFTLTQGDDGTIMIEDGGVSNLVEILWRRSPSMGIWA